MRIYVKMLFIPVIVDIIVITPDSRVIWMEISLYLGAYINNYVYCVNRNTIMCQECIQIILKIYFQIWLKKIMIINLIHEYIIFIRYLTFKTTHYLRNKIWNNKFLY